MAAILPTIPLTSLPEPLNLPNPRHAKRVPVHIGKELFARIRQAAIEKISSSRARRPEE